ncbi:hypothetical protein P170DRAFT_418954 [Aspergillus steynii IBT 23096]|uniref:SNF2 family helicase/ATPase n=1 Tax=Aspergillus steynii IBT 23096 TaxID=1392250 RepID=A0A2I2FRA9_9EURO|nr:uncharacterized protein P170DRAFT_418954 [Aspergillus steynii IBT 23096]PLB43170.1 hypothetical protein P170DRAFT_418954 [Aspergillus steynii IBT 23096]
MQIASSDPLDWTVDEVVGFLCHNPDQPWSQSATRGPRPDPASFETALRDNFVTGEVLLHDVNKTELREDLGLKTLGHVSSMLRAIRFLQDNSLKFKGNRGYPNYLEDHQNIPSPTPFSPMGVTPRLTSTVRSEASHTLGNATPHRGDSRNRTWAMASSAIATPHTQKIPLNTSPTDNQFAMRPGPTSDTVPEPRQTTAVEQDMDLDQSGEASSLSLHARPQEHVIIDSSGKKRRRLDLKSTAEVKNNKETPGVADAQKGKVWYMGPERITHADVFYSPDLDEIDSSFVITGPELPPAQRRFVNKSLSYFYKQQPIKLPTDKSGKDSAQWAVIPYSSKMVHANNPKLFTLYTSKGGDVEVSTEQLSNWPQFNTLPSRLLNGSTETVKSHDPYADLLQRYPPQDDDQDIYPEYGDSGSEGEFDEQTWQEIQDEQREAVPHRLTPAEVKCIIADCISDYKAKWCQDGQKKEEAKAQRLWLTAKRSKRTNQMIKALHQEITNLEKRLGKLQERICDSTFSSRVELQTLCQSMEQTVMDIEKNKWRISTLERESRPPKALTPPRRSYAPKARRNLEDEESLHSESDYWPDDDPYDFIDDTSVVNEETLHGDDVPMTTPSTSDSDDDIISPSGIRRNSKKSRRLPFRESSSPSPSPKHDAMASYIDLTADSPPSDELNIETPPLNPVQSVVAQSLEDPFVENRMSPSMSPEPQLGPALRVEIPVKTNPPPRDLKNRASPALPSFDDISGIQLLSWDLLQERKDRRRLLMKLLAGLTDGERKKLALKVPQYGMQPLREHITAALKRLQKGQKFMDNMEKSESKIIMRIASLYISWVNCTHLQMKGIPKSLVRIAQEDLEDGFSDFFALLCGHLAVFYRQGENILGPLKEPPSNHSETPHKKRKREIKESQAVKMNQQSAHVRVRQNEEQRKRAEQKMESMGIGKSNNDPTHQAVSFKDPIIYLDPYIGKRVMPHQLSGIQFMWRELLEDENEQGCLLAHTMGLGKTMQVVSLLATISATASSNDPNISQQVPSCFKESKTLVVSPASLVENWYEEFIMWSPPNSSIGPLRKITSSSPPHERLQTLAEWDAEGGVLILSYHIFRAWIVNKKTGRGDKPPLSDEHHQRVQTMLLEGPDIVVADEAHMMKNRTSAVSQATMQFRTKRRIALTGSPLANNLVDYYNMVNWIAEGYLGGFLEFKANFVEPIEEGLYADSTRSERRKSLVKLKALNNNLEPKLNRADITVLEGSLPPKTEFVLTIPLTPLQKAAYDLYVENAVQGKGDERINSTRLWSWLGVLSLCCNHPACFRDKLLSRASDAQKPDKKSDEAEELPEEEQIPEAPLPDSDVLISQEESLFSTVSDIKALELSYRAEILNRIITESIKAGDKLLIFSHSLRTLDYIEHVMKMTSQKYLRLDGHTPSHSRQAATKQFNHGSENVYLISTRAGGLGLNIPGANRVVIFDFGFSPMWEQQAVGRVYRLGQKKPVFVYRFIAGGTFEEMIYNRATFKTQLAFRVVDKKNPIRAATKPLKNYLFPAKAVPQTDTDEFLGKDPQVLDKILSDKDNYPIRKISLTKTLERDDNDKLSTEEELNVQQETSDLNLLRTDPAAYQRLLGERQRLLLAAARPNAPGTSQLPAVNPYASNIPPSTQSWAPSAPVSHMQFSNFVPFQPQQQQQQQPYFLAPAPVVPSNAHNDGPPPLAPDMIS